jgi:hypothetical protein
MASYTGIFAKGATTDEIADKIQRFEETQKRDVASPKYSEGQAFVAFAAKYRDYGTKSCRTFCIAREPEQSWTSIDLNIDPWPASRIAGYLSRSLRTHCLLIYRQTTAGFHYYQLFENGKSVRLLSYTNGEPMHDEEGEQLPEEIEIVERNNASLEPADLEYMEELEEEARVTMTFPTGDDIAEALGVYETAYNAKDDDLWEKEIFLVSKRSSFLRRIFKLFLGSK